MSSSQELNAWRGNGEEQGEGEANDSFRAIPFSESIVCFFKRPKLFVS